MAKTSHETKEKKAIVYNAHATIGLVYYSMGELAHALDLLLASQRHQTESNQLLLLAAQIYWYLGKLPPPQVAKQKWKNSFSQIRRLCKYEEDLR